MAMGKCDMGLNLFWPVKLFILLVYQLDLIKALCAF